MLKFLVINDELSGERKIATRIARIKPEIIVPLTEVNGFIFLKNLSKKNLIINCSN